MSTQNIARTPLNVGKTNRERDEDQNRDPITDEPGAHPVGVGIGAGTGALAGAAVGSIAGPVGAAFGAMVGGVAGGYAGKAAAEEVNPTEELNYWRTTWASRPYATHSSFDLYEPAYRVAIDEYAARPQRVPFEQIEPKLRATYQDDFAPVSGIAWDDARHASQDAWDRMIASRTSAAAGAKADTAQLLNNVLQMLNDSVDGFASAAEKLEDPKFASACRRFVSERAALSAELRPLIAAGGVQPTTATEIRGSLSRAWMSLSSALGGGDQAIINAIEAAEDHAVATYRETIASDDIPAETRELLNRHYAVICAAHEQFRTWKHEKAAS